MKTFQNGDAVRFKKELWEAKKLAGMHPGFFGHSLTETSINSFIFYGYFSEGKVVLKDYPWSVSEEEIERFPRRIDWVSILFFPIILGDVFIEFVFNRNNMIHGSLYRTLYLAFTSIEEEKSL